MKSVVVVASEADVLQSAVTMLESDGYSVHGFTQPAQALAYMKEAPPSAVVADLSSEMIRSSGLPEFFRHQDAAVVALAHAGDAAPVDLPAYDYVTKPLAADGLSRSVARAIAHRELVDEISRLRKALDAKTAEMSEAFQIPTLPENGVSLKDVERELLSRALEKFRGNQTRTARYLNISRRTLIYRIGKYNLKGMPMARMAAS